MVDECDWNDEEITDGSKEIGTVPLVKQRVIFQDSERTLYRGA